MKLVRHLDDLRAEVALWRGEGARVGLVPTMGALHAGHLSLVAAAEKASDRVIATIFVNPKQFDNAGDLAKYPRSETEDARLLETHGVDLLYAPDLGEIYPDGFATTVSVSGVSEGLCGAHRPGHFDGVATIVAKLFIQTGADTAFFGEKDFQQVQVVRRLVRDLDIPIEIVGCPIVREEDGLALSSRNRRLTPEKRAIAPALHKGLAAAADGIVAGKPVGEALADAARQIVADGFDEVEYLELRSEEGLVPMTTLDAPARILAAAWLDGIRLIDNVPVEPLG